MNAPHATEKQMKTLVSVQTRTLPKDAAHATTLPLRFESSGVVHAPVELVFAHLDHHKALTGHMSESSWRMGGGRMQLELDADKGQRVGSEIRLAGRVLGFQVAVAEVVTERTPPCRKVWETIGHPKLLVIGAYRMGFQLSTRTDGCLLRVFIEYSLPDAAPARWLGYLFARYYAKWCTRQMVDDAVKHFALAT